jgi:hypothetical protein
VIVVEFGTTVTVVELGTTVAIPGRPTGGLVSFAPA